MGRIYQAAEMVVVWLGKSTPLYTLGISDIQHLVDNKIEFDPVRDTSHEKKKGESSISVPGLSQAAVEKMCRSALLIVLNQWFRRIWVIQEFCWAKDVVFVLDRMELSTETVLKAFEIVEKLLHVQDFRGGTIIPVQFLQVLPVYFPQIQNATLRAREYFQHDGLWSLRQWLLVCRGRLSSNPRDLIFGGLSLINPQQLQINSDLLSNSEPESVGPEPGTRLPKIQPSNNPARTIHNLNYDGTSASTPGARQSLIPNGLWARLEARYTVDIAEVLVNTASCLISNTGMKELLSLAQRPEARHIWSEYFIKSSGDQIDLDEIPSWVPAPGSWKTTLKQPLAFRPEKFFEAGFGFKGNPSISPDGTSLLVDAIEYDSIEQFIKTPDPIHRLDYNAIKALLNTITTFSAKNPTPAFLESLSRVLFLPSGPSVSQDRGKQEASTWFCHSLSYAVLNNILIRHRQIHWRAYKLKHDPTGTYKPFKEPASIVAPLEQIQKIYPASPWPDWSNARAFDLAIRTSLARHFPNPDAFPAPGAAPDAQSTTTVQVLPGQSVPLGPLPNGEKCALGPDFCAADQQTYTRLSALADAERAWSAIFVTAQGRVGLGPTWLLRGDVVMVIGGAPVPFAFRALEKSREERLRGLEVDIEDNEMRYEEEAGNVRNVEGKWVPTPVDVVSRRRGKGKLGKLDDEWVRLRRGYNRALTKGVKKGGWVLQGEVFVEGIMEKQGVGGRLVKRVVVV
ncbi:unnamed protein product [Periconia digitata]|uniref:Heterokaryon incompatibility domain-containing protein n=1 Tax=Periconia digitata TaxID=1303443 RepID=A0A9W4UNK6_9PLEO|nr:unnamed protein product [Periconia digitata]